jgi:hypothetical protein
VNGSTTPGTGALTQRSGLRPDFFSVARTQNKRVNLTRRRSDDPFSCQTARRLRAPR